MDDKILNCYKLIENVDKLSIKEYVNLLKENNHDARSKFIIGFLPYIYQIALRIYELKKEDFSAYYDFEELFNDGIMLAISLYDNFKYGKDNFDYSIFNTYCNYFRLQFLNNVSKGYFMNVSTKTYVKISNVLKIKKKFYQKYGKYPSIQELSFITGYDVRFIKNVFDCINIEKVNFGSFSFEDKLLDKMCQGDLRDDLISSIDSLSTKDKDIICKAFGLEGNKKMTYAQIGEEYHVSRARIGQIVMETFEKIKESSPSLEKHLRG